MALTEPGPSDPAETGPGEPGPARPQHGDPGPATWGRPVLAAPDEHASDRSRRAGQTVWHRRPRCPRPAWRSPSVATHQRSGPANNGWPTRSTPACNNGLAPCSGPSRHRRARYSGRRFRPRLSWASRFEQVLPLSLGYLAVCFLGEGIDHFIRRRPYRSRAPIQQMLLPIDSVYLAVLTVPSGGAQSDFILLFAVQLIAVTLLASPRTGVRLATLGLGPVDRHLGAAVRRAGRPVPGRLGCGQPVDRVPWRCGS